MPFYPVAVLGYEFIRGDLPDGIIYRIIPTVIAVHADGVNCLNEIADRAFDIFQLMMFPGNIKDRLAVNTGQFNNQAVLAGGPVG